MSRPNPLQPSKQLQARYRAAKRHRFYCVGAVALTALFLLIFFGSLIQRGYTAFVETQIQIEFTYTPDSVSAAYLAVPRELFPLISRAWYRSLPRTVEANPELMGQTRHIWVTATADVDMYNKGFGDQLSPAAKATIERLDEAGKVRMAFNSGLFLEGDSKIATNAGLLSSLVGSLYVMLVVLLISFPVGVCTAVYLEEFAPDNKFTQLIQININNLAAVPSILYGLLGLAVFINFFGMPRSSALVGGLTISMMTLPYIIISTRAALQAVPQSIRHGAQAMGVSRWQAVRDHVLPLSLPGILTGTIIGIAHGLGETAPLLLVGMIAYIPDAPTSLTQAATVLPAQIYSWASMPGEAYRALTAAGILVLLAMVILLNATAIILRNRFERRW